ncbi:eCIS core domain-containing protein [Actinokineospora sp.]|uniref:eCIS core domain-containing protein n=1 Tax=Actinokineospora sp. TaxID=1872133 RepID=UPI00403766F2
MFEVGVAGEFHGAIEHGWAGGPELPATELRHARPGRDGSAAHAAAAADRDAADAESWAAGDRDAATVDRESAELRAAGDRDAATVDRESAELRAVMGAAELRGAIERLPHTGQADELPPGGGFGIGLPPTGKSTTDTELRLRTAGGEPLSQRETQLAPGRTTRPERMAMAVVESFVPAVLTGALRRALAVDVSDVTVRRGGGVSQVAHRLGARGYTHAGVVHVPDSVGALDGGDAGPLLAHELTHVAQQRRFGSALPAIDTADGQRLEAEAVAVEQWYAGGAGTAPPEVSEHLDPGAPRRLRSRSRPAADVQLAPREGNFWDTPEARTKPELSMDGLKDQWRAGTEPGTPDFWDTPEAHTKPTLSMGGLKEMWRAESGQDAPDPWDTPDAHTKPKLALGGLKDMWRDMRRQAQSHTNDDEDDDDEPRTAGPVLRKPGKPRTGNGNDDDDDDEDMSAVELSMEAIKDELADDPPLRWMNLDDSDDFDELADRLYNTLISRLRFDVLVERERSGTLLDFS